jgi:UDP-N-acetylglucosamine 2-epimerase (non-hydrolysing)
MELLYDANIIITKPLGYKKFMKLILDSSIVITDSGGIQEETTYLCIPCLTVRENTERPITITNGTNKLINIDKIYIQSLEILHSKPSKCRSIEYWDGHTAKRVVKQIMDLTR